MSDMTREKHQQEISKSRVRVRITYLMGGSYAFASIGLNRLADVLQQHGTGAWRLFRPCLDKCDDHRLLVRLSWPGQACPPTIDKAKVNGTRFGVG